MYFDNKNLLRPPVSRAAYSDRTAWLMAEMSRLSYFKFEGDIELGELSEIISKESEPKSILKLLEKLLSDKNVSKSDAEAKLKDYLGISEFKLVSIFSSAGTQAFIATSDKCHMNVLVFRGTESDIRDIKTDLKATTIEIKGDKVHSGFYNAFCSVKDDIEKSLDNLDANNYPLYIAGHSLGGALAIIATKYLASDSLGACYTFGSPRVASSSFGDSIKTPIYRVVNAADLVPRVPPAYIQHILIAIFEVIRIPFLSSFIVRALENMIGYRHHGDMRFLTASKPDMSDLRLISNPTIIDRGIRLVRRLLTNWKAGATDHFVQGYCDKLEAFAEYRNK